MPYINSPNPWAEAADMGASAADKLGQMMFQMPLQRAQIQMQLKQAQAAQQQELLRYALQQQAQQQQQAQFQQQFGLDQQKIKTEQERAMFDRAMREKELVLMQKQLEAAESKNKMAMMEPRFNKETGAYEGYFDYGKGAYVPAPQATNATPGMPMLGAHPATGGQVLDNAIKGLELMGRATGSGMETNNPGFWNAITNLVVPLAGQASSQFRPQGLPLPQTNAPSFQMTPMNPQSRTNNDPLNLGF